MKKIIIPTIITIIFTILFFNLKVTFKEFEPIYYSESIYYVLASITFFSILFLFTPLFGWIFFSTYYKTSNFKAEWGSRYTNL
jgi:multisubunit Na+/H+ antiporter MnhB subunit